MRVFLTGGSGFLGRALTRALTGRGDSVVALARSEQAAQVVNAAGAQSWSGDLDDRQGLTAGMRGAHLVVHAAAKLTGGPRDKVAMHRVNVAGTDTVLAAARAAGVPTVVHISTEQVLLGGQPIIDADETWPYPRRPLGFYGATKALAEQHVLAAADDHLRALAVRPRFIWGAGDTTILPELVTAANGGALQWIGGGHFPTSTCHVDNVVEGVLAAAEHGRAGHTYFLTDGDPVDFRDFVTDLLATQEVRVPTRTIPRPMAYAAAAVTEAGWALLRQPGTPPLDRATVRAIGSPCTVRDTKARAELGYHPSTARPQGLAELRAAGTTESRP
jgi:nucleoside-diphosphate-sugar epimerase